MFGMNEDYKKELLERLGSIKTYQDMIDSLSIGEILDAHDEELLTIDVHDKVLHNRVNKQSMNIDEAHDMKIFKEELGTKSFRNTHPTPKDPYGMNIDGTKVKKKKTMKQKVNKDGNTEYYVDEHEEVEDDAIADVVTIWKNPKPKVKNKKVLNKGDLVLVNGHPLMGAVIEVKGDNVVLDFAGKAVYTSSEDVYPYYLQVDNSIIKVGNVARVKGYSYSVLVKKIYGKKFTDTNGVEHETENIKKLFTRTRTKEVYDEYLCGGIRYNGKDYTDLKSLKGDFQTIDFKSKKLSVSLESDEISKHYSISIDKLKPKEDDISLNLKTTLEHPLNVAKKRWALLVGPSGSGKTEVAVSYCEEVARDYVKLQGTAQLTVDDLIGYKSLTTGEYVTSLLREAVEEGKVFILDEIDACNPNTLLVLNGLKQKMFQFPDKLVEVHQEFRVIGTANTLEYSEEYNARAPMDKATKARFKVIEYTMAPQELAIRYGIRYVKKIKNIDRLTPREVEGQIIDMRIEEEMKNEQTSM